MIQNLAEQFLYRKLPAARIKEDERGLLEALLGGIQDRVSDLRSYSAKIGQFWTPGALPDGANNVVLVDVAGGFGKTYTRSIDLDSTTPPDGSPRLLTWAAAQLGVSSSNLANARYGQDLLRLVDANILSYLAATIGAVLFQSMALTSDEQVQANVQLVDTWFPRLKLKGTAQSFSALGRILGFDDVRMTPLWSRLSPRTPEDIGDPSNDPDFAASPAYLPAQDISAFYNPFEFRDGPFFSWSTTVTNGTADSSFYTQAVNGFNPWINVELLGTVVGTTLPGVAGGVVQHPASGSYALAGGLPNFKAFVEPEGSSVRFEALTEGESFNGLAVQVATSGSLCTLSISDRLSAIKYRSSFFDIAVASDMDRLEEIFGSRAATTNKDLAANPIGSDGTAVSPYTPWIDGTFTHIDVVNDWITSTGTHGSAAVHRRQANPTQSRQLNMDSIVAAGVQVIQAMDDVRAATRLPRKSQVGFLTDDPMAYASYGTGTPLFTALTGTMAYSGVIPVMPNASATMALRNVPYMFNTWDATIGATYGLRGIFRINGTFGSVDFPIGVADRVDMSFLLPGGWRDFEGVSLLHDPPFASTFNWVITIVYLSGTLNAESDPSNPQLGYYQNTVLDTSGTFNAQNGSFSWNIPSENWGGSQIVAEWHPLTTEVVRSEPAALVKQIGTVASELRPEDQTDADTDELSDDVAWRRDIVAGGMLADLDTYSAGTELGIDQVSDATAFRDQTGAEYNVYGITSVNQPMRFTTEVRPTDSEYAPGNLAVGYRGTFKDLSTYTGTDTDFPKPTTSAYPGDTRTDFDSWFNPGYEIFHVGLAQGVLVSDLSKFCGPHHTDGLVGWLPFNEHPEDDLDVVDHSATQATSYLTNLGASDRVWDAAHGWVIQLDGGQVSQSAFRNIEDEATLSCWVKVTGGALPSSAQVIVSCGPIQIGLNTDGSVTGYCKGPGGFTSVATTVAINDGQWRFIYLTKSAALAVLGIGDFNTSATETSLGGYFPALDSDDQSLTISGVGCQLAVHDLRLWNQFKTTAQLELVRNYNPTPTICTYPLGVVVTVDKQDKYGLKVLPNGWVVTDALPANYRRANLGLVRWYDSMGSYFGPARYKETGINAGGVLSGSFALGQQFTALTGFGTLPYSTASGYLPGNSSYWAAQTGSSTGTLDQMNTFREKLWAKDISGKIYTLWLDGDTQTTYLVAELSGDDAGAFVTTFSVATLTAAGSVPYNGIATLSSYYMYLNSRISAEADNAATTWTDFAAVTVQDNHVDYAAQPSIVYFTGSGTYLNTPVLGANGVLEFQNNGQLPAGNYQLTIESGNVGQTDVDFDGFDVNISINSDVFSRTLLSGQTGYNIAGQDTFDIELTDSIVGNWLMAVEWTNALEDTSKGTKRQLAIYGYTLRRVFTSPYKVQFSTGAPCTPIITALLYGTGTTPGGWYETINSYGTSVGYAHESQIYTVSDTVANPSPLSNVLTGLTNTRREDIIYTGTTVILSDPATYSFPTFSAISVSPSKSLYQVGDTGTFTVVPSGSVSAIYSYVWAWWDGTGTATPGPGVAKVINIGGNPGAGPGGLQFSCTPVGFDGQNTVIVGTINVNDPPSLAQAAISENDGYFSFTTRASLEAFDLNHDAMTFSWYSGTTLLGSGVTSSAGTVNGTWQGNGVTSVVACLAESNYLDTTVSSDRILTCIVSDARGGTSSLDFDLRGQPAPTPVASASAGASGLFADALTLPSQRIGQGQTVEFTVYAKDPAGATLGFGWSFYGSNGWTMGPVDQTNGVTTVLPDGGYQNVLTRNIDSEVVSSGTAKNVLAVCNVIATDTVSGAQRVSEVDVSATLVADNPPNEFTITRKVAGNEVIADGPVTIGQAIEFSVSGNDPNGDAVTFFWTFAQPFVPTTGLYWGPKVVIDTSNYQTGQQVQGSLIASDRLGATIYQVLPVTSLQ